MYQHQTLLEVIRQLSAMVEEAEELDTDTACAILKDINDIRMKIVASKNKKR